MEEIFWTRDLCEFEHLRGVLCPVLTCFLKPRLIKSCSLIVNFAGFFFPLLTVAHSTQCNWEHFTMVMNLAREEPFACCQSKANKQIKKTKEDPSLSPRRVAGAAGTAGHAGGRVECPAVHSTQMAWTPATPAEQKIPCSQPCHLWFNWNRS